MAEDTKRMTLTILEQKIEAFHERCRRKGLRITPQRTAVYKLLIQSTEHPTADNICAKAREDFPNLSLDTVCRTLKTLTDAGEIFIVEGSGDPKRFDANLEEHSHFRCLRCKRVIDVFGNWSEKLPDTGSLLPGCRILKKSLYLEGICSSCSENHNMPENKALK